jgi:hypothetical protein
VLPVISQTAGTSNLSVTTGAWTNTPSSYAYQWRRNGADVAGANASTYTIPDTDSSTVWDCRVTATNAGGNASITAAALFVGMLDRISTAAARAHAMRRLTRNYSGAILRVQRNDNAEQDIPATITGDLDVAALLAFVYAPQSSFLGTASGYSPTGATYTPGAVGGLLIETAEASTLHRMQKNVSGTLAAGTAYKIVTVVNRVGASRSVSLELFANGGAFAPLVKFDPNTLTTEVLNVSGAASLSASILRIGVDAWVCEMTVTPTSAQVNPLFLAGLMDVGAGATRVYTGDGASGIRLSTPALGAMTGQHASIAVLHEQVNGVHASNSITPANRPRIVQDGSYTGWLDFTVNGNNGALMYDTDYNSGQQYAASAVLQWRAPTGDIVFGDRAANSQYLRFSGSAQNSVRLVPGNDLGSPWSTTGNGAVALLSKTDASNGAGYVNGASVGTGNNGAASGGYTSGLGVWGSTSGAGGNGGWAGKEFIIFPVTLPTDWQRMQRNQGAYYGVTVA